MLRSGESCHNLYLHNTSPNFAHRLRLFCFGMMTSSNGNIFRVTGHFCGETTDHRWIPHKKASDADLWCFSLICAWIDGWVNNGEAGDLRRYRAYYDVIVMIWSKPNGRCSYLSGLLQWHWGYHEQTMKIGLIQWSHFKLLEFSIWRKILGQTSTLCTAYFLFMAKQGLSQWEKTLHMCVTRLGPCSSISRKRAHIAWAKL